ncbi:MAG: hypothetical protein HFJ47_00060 [Clostridia bacterium]|nr:hypothetical protein [Clostridia bacterium]
MKEKLIQYCDLQKEIENLEKRIDKIRKQSDLIADVVQNGVKGHAVVRGIDWNRQHKLDKLEAVLQERYDKLLDMQTEIEEWINAIERSDIRQIIEYRYIDNMSWYQIQTTMGYRHEDTARKKHDAFLEKIA